MARCIIWPTPIAYQSRSELPSSVPPLPHALFRVNVAGIAFSYPGINIQMQCQLLYVRRVPASRGKAWGPRRSCAASPATTSSTRDRREDIDELVDIEPMHIAA